MSFDPAALAKLVEESGVPYRQNAISWVFACPRCGKSQKLYIRKRDGQFRCWVCAETQNFKGRAEWALRELIDIPVRKLQERLYGGDIPEQLVDLLELELDDVWGESGGDEVSMEAPIQAVAWPPDFFPLGDSRFIDGARYLYGRGVTAEHVLAYDIRYCPAEKRVVFPVKVDGQLIGWQGRYIGKTEAKDQLTGRVYKVPKIITSESLRGSGHKYVMFQDRLKGAEHCVLTEGPVSAIKAHLCGGGNVATMGKAVSEHQLETVLSYGAKKIYFGLDPDAAPDIARLRKLLPAEIEAYLLLPPPSREDLGDCTPEEVLTQFRAAPRLSTDALMLSLGSEFVW